MVNEKTLVSYNIIPLWQEAAINLCIIFIVAEFCEIWSGSDMVPLMKVLSTPSLCSPG